MAKHTAKRDLTAQPVAEGTGAIVASVVTKRHRPSLKLVAVVVGILIVAGLAVALWRHHDRQQRLSYAGQVCDASVAASASTVQATGNVTVFTTLYNQVRAKANYAKDPECLYIIAEYQILNDDLSAAQATITNLQHTYGSYTFSPNLGSKASIATLKQQLKTAQEAEQNSNGRIDPGI